MIYLLGYLLTIPLANWFIGHVGDCAHGPCVIPVWWGLYAPSGVLWTGLAFSLRDAVQERLGRWWTTGTIIAGAVLSLAVSDPFVATASGIAFGVSEFADFAIYTPLRERGYIRAVVASNVVGSAVDSVAFLLIAFGSLDFLAGQLVGKWLMIVPAMLAVWLWRRRALLIAAVE